MAFAAVPRVHTRPSQTQELGVIVRASKYLGAGSVIDYIEDDRDDLT